MLGTAIEIPGYEILQELAAGGMATVFLARHEGLDRQVAIKVLRGSEKTEHLLERFADEAQLIAALDHPGIVTIYDVGETTDGALFYAMRYLSQGHLRDRNLVDTSEIQQVFSKICDGLSYAHQNGITHRDLKPENILFDRQGNPQIADFGIALSAKRTTRHTRIGETLGSVHFMSPEQARGERVDHRSDIYSLGAVLFEVLTGEPPFDAPDELAIMYAHTSQSIPELPASQRQWQAVIEKAMAKLPAQRYQSAAELKRAIESLPLTPATGWVDWFETRRKALAIAAASLAGVLVVANYLSREPEPAVDFFDPQQTAAGDQVSVDQINPTSFDSATEIEPDGSNELAVVIDKEPTAQQEDIAPETVVIPAELVRPDGQRHTVERAFAMGRYEVTRDQYQRFSEATGRTSADCGSRLNIKDSLDRLSWRAPGFGQSASDPVVCVSWEDATAYTQWLSEQTGERYRLPTVAEWWHVAWSGHESDIACETGNVAGQESSGLRISLSGTRFSCADAHRHTAPIGQFQPTRAGVFDVRGNVAEWTQDCPAKSLSIGRIVGRSSDRCERRIYRGTSWRDGKQRAMLAHKGAQNRRRGLPFVGFRVVREL